MAKSENTGPGDAPGVSERPPASGAHDMGGGYHRDPVGPALDEPVFHEDWEGRVFALRLRTNRWMRGRSMGNHRYELECIPAAYYHRMSYYERWFSVLVDRLLRSNLVTAAEFEVGAADLDRPLPALLPASAGDQVGGARLAVDVASRIKMDDWVRARSKHPHGHTRLPRYIWGKRGQVARDHGVFAFQDTGPDGLRLGEFPQHVYTVQFSARELWGNRASVRDSVFVDLWEGYVTPD